MKSSILKIIRRYWEYIIFSFFSVSIAAWFLEILYSFIIRGKFVLPGTLSGPWCPVYGTTLLVLLLFVEKKDHPAYNFVKIFVIATIVEYIASFISGEIFHNVIWDYSERFMNINGRVCLGMSLIFAILGYIMIYAIEPWLRRIYIQMKDKIKIINIFFIGFFLLDIFINIFFI